MTDTQNVTVLRSYGTALVFMAIALNSLELSLHPVTSVALAMNAASVLASCTAVGLFFKASKGGTRRVLIASVVVVAVAGLVAAFVILHHRA